MIEGCCVEAYFRFFHVFLFMLGSVVMHVFSISCYFIICSPLVGSKLCPSGSRRFHSFMRSASTTFRCRVSSSRLFFFFPSNHHSPVTRLSFCLLSSFHCVLSLLFSSDEVLGDISSIVNPAPVVGGPWAQSPPLGTALLVVDTPDSFYVKDFEHWDPLSSEPHVSPPYKMLSYERIRSVGMGG